jgi:hypothetical protein
VLAAYQTLKTVIKEMQLLIFSNGVPFTVEKLLCRFHDYGILTSPYDAIFNAVYYPTDFLPMLLQLQHFYISV